MAYKESIQNLLISLKKAGFSRGDLEARLGLAPNSIDQTLSRGGTKRLFTSLTILNDQILNNSISEEQTTGRLNEPKNEGKWHDKYIQNLEVQNEFLRRNFETSLTTILKKQDQSGKQMATVLYYTALAAHGGDHQKAIRVLAEVSNDQPVSWSGVGEGGSLQKEDKPGSGGRQKKKV